MPIERGRPSPPPFSSTWQLAQERLLFLEKRVSWNRRSPSAILRGSSAMESGIGVIASPVAGGGSIAALRTADAAGGARIGHSSHTIAPLRASAPDNQSSRCNAGVFAPRVGTLLDVFINKKVSGRQLGDTRAYGLSYHKEAGLHKKCSVPVRFCTHASWRVRAPCVDCCGARSNQWVIGGG